MSFVLGLVPHDDRPVSLDQVVDQVAACGVRVLVPPGDLLGHRTDPGDVAAVREWLRAHAAEADSWVLSADMLIFGGLVASRTPEVDADGAAAAVEEVARALAPCAPGSVYAFASLRRLAPTARRQEDLGAWRAGHAAPADPEERRPNRAVAEALVERAGEGGLGALALLQEDCRPDPVLAAEHAALLAGASDAVALAPGADEGARALAARALAERAGRGEGGDGVRVEFSGELAGRGGAQEAVAPYEDRPVGATLEGQLAVAGLHQDPDAAATLLVWSPPGGGRDLWLAASEERSADAGSGAAGAGPDHAAERAAFLARLAEGLARGERLVVADVAHANGADPWLWRAREAAACLPRLHGFAAWNTAGNTLGCALAQLRLPRDPRQLAARVLEDWGFQTEVRPVATRWARKERGADPWDLGGIDQARVESFATYRLRRWWSETFAPGTWGVSPREHVGVRLPWSRLFEAAIELEQEGSPG